MKPISCEEKAQVINLLDMGISARKIADQVKISPMTVKRVKDKYSPSIAKSKGGRLVGRMILSGEADTAIQAADQLRSSAITDASPSTIRRALKEGGLVSRMKAKKPRLLARHKTCRYQFAKKYKDWTIEDWKRVIWSDEAKITRLCSNGRQWVWKRSGAGFTDREVAGTVKFGGGGLMVWGCMSAKGVGYMARIDGGLDAQLYVSILQGEFLQTLEYYGYKTTDVVFQQDNDPKHTSNLVKNWLRESGIEVLDWPAQSPDLNPIEHLWWEVKRKLNSCETQPASIHELWERIQEVWEGIPAEKCLDLITSMPRRVAAVLKAKGGHTKY